MGDPQGLGRSKGSGNHDCVGKEARTTWTRPLPTVPRRPGHRALSSDAQLRLPVSAFGNIGGPCQRVCVCVKNSANFSQTHLRNGIKGKSAQKN